ncbi:MAG: diguanylate cyclase [Deltaproteobacteria bacterium]
MKPGPRQNILLVDDHSENLMALEAILEGEGRNIVKANSGNEALGLLSKFEFSLALLDVQMPEMDGFETASRIRNLENCRHIPIIFVSAVKADNSQIFRGYEAGAVDYIFKPLEPAILTAKVDVFLQIYNQRLDLEEKTRILLKTIEQQEEYKRIIEEQNRALRELAIRDGLTGIYNHRHFQELLVTEVERAKRYKNEICCMMMDLDFFKEVNDSHGHQFGDFVLKECARLISHEIRSSDVLARYGGEEFVLLLPNVDIDGAHQVAEKIRKKLFQHSFQQDDTIHAQTISIGIYCGNPEQNLSGRDLLRYADKALYDAKEMGRNRVMVYSPDPTLEIWEA